MDAILSKLLADLAAVAAKNSAAAIAIQVSAIRARKQNEQTISELTEIINNLVSDREELIGISMGLKERLVSQQITESEIKHVVETTLPIILHLSKKAGNQEVTDNIDLLKPLLSVDVLTVFQTLGFNYRTAIGEPLTQLLRSFILSRVEERTHHQQKELELEHIRVQAELLRIVQDPNAYERYITMTK